MRIGISLSSTRASGAGGAGARSIVRRARAANEAQLDSLTLGDRHAMSAPYFQNTPMLGRLVPEWEPIRPIGCLFLLPLWHPVLVAEQIGTLATMNDKPFIVQTGIGGGQQQFDAMGADLSGRAADLEEAVRVIKALCAGETVTSERFGITNAVISPRPPHGLEWWMGAGVDRALRRAAALGDAWYTNPHYTPAQLVGPMSTYRAACDANSRPGRVVMRKDVLILSDARRARRLGDELIDGGYRGLEAENVIYGDVDAAVEQLSQFKELGVDDVMIRCMSSDDDVAVETIQHCGEIRLAFS